MFSGFSSFLPGPSKGAAAYGALPRFGTFLGRNAGPAAPQAAKGYDFGFGFGAPAAPAIGGWTSWVSYFAGIALVILAILIFIHYIITPVFKTVPGGPGFIPLPGYDTGKLYWEDDSVRLDDTKTVLNGMTKNYTLAVDLFVENPMAFSNKPRVLFYRGSAAAGSASAAGISGSIGDYNLAIALAADTNDLIVSVLNAANNEENVLLPNVPVQKAFRVSVVLHDRAMEVYVNGRLMKTRAFAHPPKEIVGPFMPPVDRIAKVRNLHLWPAVLTPGEIRAAGPKLADPAGAEAIPPAPSACPSEQ